MRRTSRRRRSRSRSRSRSRNRGADMGDLTYEQYLEAFEKVRLPPSPQQFSLCCMRDLLEVPKGAVGAHRR